MIEVKGVTKRFGRTTAVDNVSFEVRKGEILGFLGPNGAGKTTTMRIITCFLPPNEGSASVAGFDVFREPLEVKKRIGYLPELPPLYPEMTVVDYLDFVARIKRVPGPKRLERVDNVVQKCALTEVRGQQTGRLSKGYRQRVGLAQALVHDPEVLILDEPTAGLDPRQIIETRELIKGLAGEHTIILSTHILPEVSMTCERVVIINAGRVVAEDTPEGLTARMRGSEILRVTVEGAPDKVRDSVSSLAGVVQIRDAGSHNGSNTFEVETSSGQDIRRELARTIVQGGYGLLELKQVGMSLEDIYLKLTTTEEVEAKEPTGEESSEEESHS
ncbi:MAG: ABC transporter ATP-binding protein [Vicinamibacteria bacterium]